MKIKKIIHVNMHKIRSNHKSGERVPVLTVKSHKEKPKGGFYKTPQNNHYCHEVIIEGPCKVVYAPDNPQPCGARVWIETESETTCLSKNLGGE